MASVFQDVTRPSAGRFLERVLTRAEHQAPEVRLHAVLAAIDDALRSGGPIDSAIDILEESKRAVFELLRPHCNSPAVAKALALKAINICRAKQHFHARSTTLLSRPFGLIIDPSNSCNLACPGCVHSQNARERKFFQWGTGTMPQSRMSRFLSSYGPYAIHADFCNYGEPLINPETPRFIREAKGYLAGTMLSTNLSLPRLDAEAVVASGLDYMIASVDGATQPVYQTFRRKGKLDVVIRNIEKLVKAKRDLGRRTPVIVWRFLTFEHNVHEITLAAETARQLGVDQFTTHTPFDVTYDDPETRVADVPAVNLLFNPGAAASIRDNWNAFPDALNSATIDRAFSAPWVDRTGRSLPAGLLGAAGPGETCSWLYRSITVDANGRIFPCCGSPAPDADLVFSEFDSTPSFDVFNSEKYRLSRLSFVDMETFRQERERSQLNRDPHCAKCDWDKEAHSTSGNNISRYFQATARGLFNRESLAVLSSW
jgi:MoaA/NifB/PqqE/SkfB family radical SAM enzyme